MPNTAAAEIFYATYPSVLGPLTISCTTNAILSVSFGPKPLPAAHQNIKTPAANRRNDHLSSVLLSQPTPLHEEAFRQLDEYFDGKRKRFTLPLAPSGTAFQLKVWNALCEIPYGETRSYKEVAVMAGNGKACRAVGMANNRNPLPIFIPCHRVIGADGSLVGYGGGLPVKIALLDLEKAHMN